MNRWYQMVILNRDQQASASPYKWYIMAGEPSWRSCRNSFWGTSNFTKTNNLHKERHRGHPNHFLWLMYNILTVWYQNNYSSSSSTPRTSTEDSRGEYSLNGGTERIDNFLDFLNFLKKKRTKRELVFGSILVTELYKYFSRFHTAIMLRQVIFPSLRELLERQVTRPRLCSPRCRFLFAHFLYFSCYFMFGMSVGMVGPTLTDYLVSFFFDIDIIDALSWLIFAQSTTRFVGAICAGMLIDR